MQTKSIEDSTLMSFVLFFDMKEFSKETNHFINLLTIIARSEQFFVLGKKVSPEKIQKELQALEYLCFFWEEVEKGLDVTIPTIDRIPLTAPIHEGRSRKK